jgi:hypothetical protein
MPMDVVTVATIDPIECPNLPLGSAGVEEHCLALRELQGLPFWWYQGKSRLFGNFTRPFRDRGGEWWYQVKPGLCWPADFLEPRRVERGATEGIAPDSRLVINVIRDVRSYGPGAIASKRRNAVRKGVQSCLIEILRTRDHATFEECRDAWSQLTRRTGWKGEVDAAEFDRTWSMILECPGASIVVGRDTASGRVAGFLVTKIIGSTAYVDTIASRDEGLRLNVNDALIYAFVRSAAAIPGVSTAHYALKSRVEGLERFKTGIGFEPFPYPAVTRLRGPVRLALRSLMPDKYARMVGEDL